MKFGFLIIAILLLNGCGEIDKKEVSKENFKRVLNDYYARNCVLIARGEFPQELYAHNMFGDGPIKRMEALEKLGYLTSEKIKKENKHSEPKKRFILTEKGKKVYVNKEKNQGICAFTRQIKSIDNYTEPSNMMGITMTRVNFTFEPIKSTDTLNEMKNEKALADFIDEVLKKTLDRAELILTGMKGWIHQREFKK
jgi:DNA-binding PadR family transcriptional regulator